MQKLKNERRTNEEILEELNNICGAEKCKEVLESYAMYLTLKKEKKMDFGTYNMMIKNPIESETSKQIIEVIWKLLKANNVISTKYRYLNEDEVREDRKKESKKENKKIEKNTKNKKVKEIKEDMLIIDSKELGGRLYGTEKNILNLMNIYKDKVFILVDAERFCGWDIEDFNNLITWKLNVKEFSKEDKEKYIKNFLNKNKIKIDNKCSLLNTLSNKKYEELKDEILNIVIKTKINDIDKINNNNIKAIYSGKINMKREINKTAIEELDSMIGVQAVKHQVEQIINYIKVNKDRGKMPMLHMCFLGNPGTGKTTVARIFGKMFAEQKILSEKGKFVEVHGRDLIAKFVGWTAAQTKQKVEEAEGGVLFIDEAYSLTPTYRNGYEQEAIATLIKEMEDKRDNLCVILAGYTNEMYELLKANPGFESRIQFKIQFPDYTEEELYEIFKKMAKEDNYKVSPQIKDNIIKYFEYDKKKENFANAREVRNLFEKVKFEQADRVVKTREDSRLIKRCDVQNAIGKFEKIEVKKTKIGF